MHGTTWVTCAYIVYMPCTCGAHPQVCFLVPDSSRPFSSKLFFAYSLFRVHPKVTKRRPFRRIVVVVAVAVVHSRPFLHHNGFAFTTSL